MIGDGLERLRETEYPAVRDNDRLRETRLVGGAETEGDDILGGEG